MSDNTTTNAYKYNVDELLALFSKNLEIPNTLRHYPELCTESPLTPLLSHCVSAGGKVEEHVNCPGTNKLGTVHPIESIGDGCQTEEIKKNKFTDYISDAEIKELVKNGQVITGPLRINKRDYTQAFVPLPDGICDVLISGVVGRNRALDGDIVAVRLLSPKDWRILSLEGAQTKPLTTLGMVLNDPSLVNTHKLDYDLRQDSSINWTDIKSARSSVLFQNHRLQVVGTVCSLVETVHNRLAVGILMPFEDGNKNFARFKPNDCRIPRLKIPMKQCPKDFRKNPSQYKEQLFSALIVKWSAPNFAMGKLLGPVGVIGDLNVEVKALLLANDVDDSEFSEDDVSSIPADAQTVFDSQLGLHDRRDFRDECVFSIDPSTARDLDDALSCRKLSDGNFQVGVHIADVSFFLEQCSHLDSIAAKRATSVYLPHMVIPMLPRRLSEELCSLNPNEDRLTVSVLWTLSPNGTVLSEWFGRSIIRSCSKLSYGQAQSIIDNKTQSSDFLVGYPFTIEDVMESVRSLHKIAQALRKHRFSSGALRVDQIRLQFIIDPDFDHIIPKDVNIYEYTDSNKLVEEFMLLANMAVARKVYESFPDSALLRQHSAPQTRALKFLSDTLQSVGCPVDASSAGALHRSLQKYIGNDLESNAKYQVLMHLVATPMTQAKYFCSAGLSKNPNLAHHYALNAPLYTHFTSPIRRFTDVMVHRMLMAALGSHDNPYESIDLIAKQADLCNRRKKASKDIQEACQILFIGAMLKKSGDTFDDTGVVTKVFDKAFDVLLLRLACIKRIYLDQHSLESIKFEDSSADNLISTLTFTWTSTENDASNLQDLSKLTQTVKIFTLVHCSAQSNPTEHEPLKWSVYMKPPETSKDLNSSS